MLVRSKVRYVPDNASESAQVLLTLSESLKTLCVPQKDGTPVLLVIAEASTGSLLSASITATSGSSAYFDRGFSVYSNASKVELLGVEKKTIEDKGAVSMACTVEMALGALRNSHANVAVAVSGISGPTGGTLEKPVGLTYIVLAIKGRRALERLEAVRSARLTIFKEESDVLLYTAALFFVFKSQESSLPSVQSSSVPSAVSQLLVPHRTAPQSHIVHRFGSFFPTMQRVEILLPWPDPQDYLIHRSDYAQRAAVQEAAVREAILALCACLKGEPLLDYVEYINKVNFQDIS